MRAREPTLLFPLALVPFACHWAKCVAKARAFTPTAFGLPVRPSRSRQAAQIPWALGPIVLKAAPSTGDGPASRNLGPVRTWSTEASGVRHPYESTAIDYAQSLHLLYLTGAAVSTEEGVQRHNLCSLHALVESIFSSPPVRYLDWR